MWQDFKAFIVRGNVLDLAVAVVIGASFGVIVKSLVDDIIMPPIGLLLGNVDFSNLFILLKAGTKAAPPYATVAGARAAGAVTINYGVFLNNVITFLIVAGAVFVVVRMANKFHRKPVATVTTKPCPHCAMDIPLAASRCPHCTSELAQAA